jgi:hypothetical protein
MLVGIMVNVLLGQAKVHNENGLVFLHARPGAEEKDSYAFLTERSQEIQNITRKKIKLNLAVYSPP